MQNSLEEIIKEARGEQDDQLWVLGRGVNRECLQGKVEDEILNQGIENGNQEPCRRQSS